MKSNQKAANVRAAIAKHEEFILNSLTSRILGRILQNVVSATSILKTLGNSKCAGCYIPVQDADPADLGC